MNRLILPAATVLLGALVSACGAARVQQTYTIPSVASGPKTAVTFVDRRPAEEKTFRNAESAVWRFGDEQFAPSRIAALEGKIASRVEERHAGAVVSIERFEVVNDFSAFQSKSNKVFWASMLTGGVGGIVAASAIDEQANGNHLLCEIRGTANGLAFQVSEVQPYNHSGSWTTTALNDPAVKRTIAEVVERCTDGAADAVAAKLVEWSGAKASAKPQVRTVSTVTAR